MSQSLGATFSLTLANGPNKGLHYPIQTQQIQIGRELDNDIVLKDPKCSRHHAQIYVENQQLYIQDLGSQNGIVVNGKTTQFSALHYGDHLSVGDTQFIIGDKNGTVAHTKAATSLWAQKNINTNKLLFYITSGVALLLIINFLNQTPQKASSLHSEKGQAQLASQAEQSTLQTIKDDTDEAYREKVSQGMYTRQYLEAQSAYIQGFRDYREGFYSRAIQNFTAALALYPSHALAQKYKRLAEQRRDELIQYHMSEGKRNFEQNKYEMAKANYRNVMILINNPTQITYQEAKQRLLQIEILLRGKY